MFKKVMLAALAANALALNAPVATASPTSDCGFSPVTDPYASDGAAIGCVTGEQYDATLVTDDSADTGLAIAVVAAAVGAVATLPPWIALCLAVALCAAWYAVARTVPTAAVPRIECFRALRSGPGRPVGPVRTALAAA